MVLVVDDGEAARETMRATLESAGYSVATLPDGRIAQAFLQRTTVDAIVLDLAVTLIDGPALLKSVQADPRLRHIRVVVLCSVGVPTPPGVAARLVKPCPPSDLLAAVERVLGGERRQSLRYPARFDVHTASSYSALGTMTHDISSGGLCYDSQVAPQVGEKINLTVDLAVHGVAAMEVEVRHVKPGPSGWRIGTRFLSFQYNAIGFEAEVALLARSTSPV
jgi:CheY-like chemotaxis protein